MVSKFSEVKKWAIGAYEGLLGKEVYCATIDLVVRFTRVGLQHLLWSHKRLRKTRDVLRRIVLLSSVVDVLEDRNATTTARNIGGKVFYAFESKRSGRNVRVIVLLIGSRNGIFFSVMDKQ